MFPRFYFSQGIHISNMTFKRIPYEGLFLDSMHEAFQPHTQIGAQQEKSVFFLSHESKQILNYFQINFSIVMKVSKIP